MEVLNTEEGMYVVYNAEEKQAFKKVADIFRQTLKEANVSDLFLLGEDWMEVWAEDLEYMVEADELGVIKG